jgi:oligoendopeptidase F
MYTADIKKLPRHFVPGNFTITDWQSLEPYFKDLLERKLETKANWKPW